MDAWPLRLQPGDDLRRALEAAVAARGLQAAFVVAGIGSLSHAQLRLANADAPLALHEALEILTLSGTVAVNGSHLHAALSRADGQVIGGHVAYGSVVRTTAELLVAALPGWRFARAPDAATGYDELDATPLR